MHPFFNGGLGNTFAKLRSPHRIVSRGDRFTWIGQLSCGGVQIIIIDVHEIANVWMMARSSMRLAIYVLCKGNKRKHDVTVSVSTML